MHISKSYAFWLLKISCLCSIVVIDSYSIPIFPEEILKKCSKMPTYIPNTSEKRWNKHTKPLSLAQASSDIVICSIVSTTGLQEGTTACSWSNIYAQPICQSPLVSQFLGDIAPSVNSHSLDSESLMPLPNFQKFPKNQDRLEKGQVLQSLCLFNFVSTL